MFERMSIVDILCEEEKITRIGKNMKARGKKELRDI
jgi:dihydroorotase-like cyclic amidohydrolase